MESKPRRHYDPEFKSKAVELAKLRGNTTVVAKELDLRPELLHKWVSRSRMQANGKMEPLVERSGGLTREQIEIRTLKEELEFARMERDILKKAVSIFSKNEDVRTR
jgi:transposase